MFTHLLFSVNVQFPRLTGMSIHSKWVSKMHVHVTMETESWTQTEDMLLGWCVLYPAWAWKQRRVNYLNSHRATAVVVTGRNFAAIDLVRGRIPHDCKMIWNYSSWKKYNLLGHILLIEKKAKLDKFFSALNYLLNSISAFNLLSSLVDTLILCLWPHKSVTGEDARLALQLHFKIMFENCERENIHLLLVEDNIFF